MRHLVIGVCVLTVACSGETPTAPSASVAPIVQSSSSTGDGGSTGGQPASSAPTAAQSRVNLVATLQGDGFGLVKLRQENHPTQTIIQMDVWVRGLLPNTSYSLQRAVDSPQDGVCTGTNWLTMGQGTTPQPILTDDSGTGRAALWRLVPATATPSDIHFRVIRTDTGNIVMVSDCHRLILSS
jgi:hypothetical protein